MPETPADRSLHDIAEATRRARPRAAGDAEDPAIPVAGTVLVVRDGAGGAEVLMIERPDRGSFARAWVFPGGKIEASDREGLPPDASEEDVARRAGVREAFEETGLVVTPVLTLSLWDPPPGIALRIRTWFFVATDASGEVTLSPGEAVRAEWVRPQDMLDRHARGGATLYPPTWVTLFSLTGARDASTLVDGARFERFETSARGSAAGPMLMWQGDGEYETDAAGPARHRLEVGTLPWVYTRTAG